MLNEHLPAGSPAHYLEPGEWQVYCPRGYGTPSPCAWTAPKNTVGGGQFGCERCGGSLRVAEVKSDGSRTDYEWPAQRRGAGQ